jgi:hypothetical protein
MTAEVVAPTKPIITENGVEIPFTRIANGNRYPNGSPLSAITMNFNQQGVMFTRDYLYKEYIEELCDKNFKKEVGATTPEFGPCDSLFAGNMTSKTIVNGPGCGWGFYSSFWFRLSNYEEGLQRIVESVTFPFYHNDLNTKDCIRNGSLVIALVRTTKASSKISWNAKILNQHNVWDGFLMPVSLDVNTKWVVLYGYTDTHWLAYDPATGQDEMYRFNPGYTLIESVFSIRRR